VRKVKKMEIANLLISINEDTREVLSAYDEGDRPILIANLKHISDTASKAAMLLEREVENECDKDVDKS
jgi:hypothetical protein